MAFIMNTPDNDLSSVIIRKRKELGMSHDELAKMIGISKSTLISYETKRSIPSVNNVIKLSKALDLELSTIIALTLKEPNNTMFDIGCFDYDKGIFINQLPDFYITVKLRKNENPDKHFCLFHNGKYLIYIKKRNNIGKEPKILISVPPDNKIVMAKLMGDSVFDDEQKEKINKCCIIAQFKRVVQPLVIDNTTK